MRAPVAAPAVEEPASSKAQTNGRENARTVASEGPLAPEAASWLSAHFATLLRVAEKRLDSSMAGTGLSTAAIAEAQLSALKDMYLYKAAMELVAEGKYLTFLVGNSPPPTPPGCIGINTTQYPLQNGKVGHAVVLVDLGADFNSGKFLERPRSGSYYL